MEDSEEEFEKISTTIKKEFEHVDEARFKEFREAVLSYLAMMLQMQEKVRSCFLRSTYCFFRFLSQIL